MKKFLLLSLLLISNAVFSQKAIEIYNFINYDIDIVKNRIEHTLKYKKLGNSTAENQFAYTSDDRSEVLIVNSVNNKVSNFNYILSKEMGLFYLKELIDNFNFNEVQLNDIGLSNINSRKYPIILMNKNNIIIAYFISENPEKLPNFFMITTLENFLKKDYKI